MISASTAADYEMLGEVTNIAGAAVNNGVLVSLDQSTWTSPGQYCLESRKIGQEK